MILDLFKRKKANAALVNAQYEVITQSARNPIFYQDFDVPDTVMGRFNMVSIFMMLYLRATNKSDAEGNMNEAVKQLAQEVVEEFFKDIDHSIRELGIGDAGVPKRMKKLGRMFYGRAENYGKALDSGDISELADAFLRNIHSDTHKEAQDHAQDHVRDMKCLAKHAFFVDQELKNAKLDDMIKAQLLFPAPTVNAAGN